MGLMTRIAGADAVPGAARDRLPIDRVHLARYTLGNLALEIEILDLFAMQAPETLAQLSSARTEKAWRDAAHTLKGSARAVGATKVGECAERAEALKAGASEIARRGAIEALRGALDEAKQYIDGLAV